MFAIIVSAILCLVSLVVKILCPESVSGGQPKKIKPATVALWTPPETEPEWFDPKTFVHGKWHISSDRKTWHPVKHDSWTQWGDQLEQMSQSEELYFADQTRIMKWRQWDKLPTDDPKTQYMRDYRVTIDTLKGTNAFLMTPYLRKWQFEHIDPVIPSGANIFDIGIGTGRSRDLWRSRRARVWGVEPDPKNFQFLIKRRIPELQDAKNWGGETPDIRTWIPPESIDVVMMSYSITFFFKDVAMLQALLANVRHVLRTGGLFVIVGMDGAVVDKWFHNANVVDNDCFQIKKFYTKRSPFGSKIEISIKNPVSLVENQTEYLVDFAMLKNSIKKDFKLLKDQHIEPPAYLSEWPAKFTTAQRFLVFRRL